MDNLDDFAKDGLIDQDVYRKISSSSTTSSYRSSIVSLIAQDELQKLLDDVRQLPADPSSNLPEDNCVITFYRDSEDPAIGITLSGASDCANKDMTVHKIIPGTLADQDGRIREGDKILSINGKLTKNLTHEKAECMLNSSNKCIILVTSRHNSPEKSQHSHSAKRRSNTLCPRRQPSSLKPILETSLGDNDIVTPFDVTQVIRSQTIDDFMRLEVLNENDASEQFDGFITVELVKDGATLGFSLEGGNDSLHGSRPLTIKRIFVGGVAYKDGRLSNGDEIVSINSVDVTSMSKFEAWNFMKKVERGPVSIIIKRI
jgi:C-terminal processing protease CtpA/Prc